jgi:hypothetical protein
VAKRLLLSGLGPQVRAVMTMYRVLRPKYEKTGETTLSSDDKVLNVVRVVEWIELGIACDMDDANKKFPRGRKNGYSHVLEPIELH